MRAGAMLRSLNLAQPGNFCCWKGCQGLEKVPGAKGQGATGHTHHCHFPSVINEGRHFDPLLLRQRSSIIHTLNWMPPTETKKPRGA